MRSKNGISLIALIITIIVIIILAAVVIGAALNTPESANRAKFACDISEIQHAVKVKLAENYNQFLTNQDSVDLNAGFTRVPVYGAPESFNSFALEGTETGTIGYLVKLDTIKMENLTIGQEYKTATDVTFETTDVFVYDSEGEVFYAKGFKYDNKIYYKGELELGSNVENSRAIIWYGAGLEAFDFENLTYVEKTYPNTSGTVNLTWDGDLTNKAVYLNIKPYNSAYLTSISVKDSNGQSMYFLNNNNELVTSISLTTTYNGYIVIPEGAETICINANNGFTLYDIHELEDLESPSKVTNISYEPQPTSIKLNWTNPSDPDFKDVVVFRSTPSNPTNYTKLGTSTTNTIEDLTGLLANTEYIYTLYATDMSNNISIETITAKTSMSEVYWYGLTAEAFDSNDLTYVQKTYPNTSGTVNITWDGDLTNKAVYLNIKPYNSSYSTSISVKDANGNQLYFLNNNNGLVTSISLSTTYNAYIVIPEGAKTICINANRGFTLYDIHELEDLESPSKVSNVTYEPRPTSVKLNWANPSNPDFKDVAVFRSTPLNPSTYTKIGTSTTGTIEDLTGLLANTEYIYTLYATDTSNNVSIEKITIKTSERNVYWYGLTAEAFDFNNSTYVEKTYPNTSGTVNLTWDGDLTNKAVYLNIKPYNSSYSTSISVKDANGNQLYFLNNNNGLVTSISLSTTYNAYIVIPEGAETICINANRGFTLYDIHELGDLESPSKVSNITYEPRPTSIKLNWTNPSNPDFKDAVVFRSIPSAPTTYTKIGTSTTGTIEDLTGLLANTDYIYTLYATDSSNNVSIEKITIKTSERNVYWYGLTAEAFDLNNSTYVEKTYPNTSGTVNLTWDGDLTNKAVYLNIKPYNSSYSTSISVKDSNGQSIYFLNNNNALVTSISLSTNYNAYIVIPEGAETICINANRGFTLYDIHELEDLESPNKVTNITYEPKSTSIKLNWTNPSNSDFKDAVVFRSTPSAPTTYTKIGTSTTGTIEDLTGLFANTDYIYTLYATDTSNNASIATINIKTSERSIYWSGLGAAAFDFNDSTNVKVSNPNSTAKATITWTGDLTDKQVYIKIQPESSAYPITVVVLDVNGNQLYFINNNNSVTSIRVTATYSGYITIPAGAKTIQITGTHSVSVYDVHEMN